jgi:hypothetical protein
VFTPVPARQIQIIQRRLLRFLDEAMQQHLRRSQEVTHLGSAEMTQAF